MSLLPLFVPGGVYLETPTGKLIGRREWLGSPYELLNEPREKMELVMAAQLQQGRGQVVKRMRDDRPPLDLNVRAIGERVRGLKGQPFNERKRKMKKPILTMLVVLLLAAVALGFYRGWFALSTPAVDQGSNKVNVNLTMDPDKMKEDAAAMQRKSAELTGTIPEKANPQ